MITGSTPSVSTSVPAVNSPSQTAPQIDFQNFLKLLTAQLRHQDPLSKRESTKFVTQLASFSTVEQLVNANAKLDGIDDKLSAPSISEFGHLIGKTAETHSPLYDPSVQIPFRLIHEPQAQTAELVMRDLHGVEVVRARVLNSDSIQLWPGLGGALALANGPYQISGEYFDNGQLIRVAPASTFSPIKEIRSVGGAVAVRLENGAEVALDDLIGLAE